MSACHECALAAPASNGRGRVPAVAVVGPPNSGKSTLFNRLTGLRQKVANFPGVTVEHRVGRARLTGNRAVDLVDLPGTYSLEPRSDDERITRDVLLGRRPEVQRPEAIILVLDATNLGRQLMLAPAVLALGLPTLVVLNMADDLRRRGGRLDPGALAQQLGATVTLTSATTGEGVETVQRFLAGRFAVPSRLELPVLQNIPACRLWAGRVADQSDYRPPLPAAWTHRLDSIVLHPVAGPLIFLGVVLAVFQGMFGAAAPLSDLIETLVRTASRWTGAIAPAGFARDLLVQGAWAGVGSVLVFLPQIMVLFLFIGVLEDSGYLARAALIADRTMARVGLQGKSFIPLLSAYACAVPAVMATRTIENRRDRLATILIAPFMTCAARLPVYTLIIAAFLPNRPLLGPLFGTRAAALLGLYVLGFVAAIGTARLLRSTILKSDRAPFVLELPPYRWPTFRSLGLRLVDRGKAFLTRAGTIILGVSVGLWFLCHLPRLDGHAPAITQSVAGTMGRAIEPAIRPLGFDWKIGIGIVTSLAAREVIVGTLGTIHGVEGGQSSLGLQRALRQDLTAGGAVALLVFFAFAMQCLSTIAVVRRETGGWKYPVLQFSYMLTLAYVGALLANVLVSRLVS
ncbi:MAG TPA: ferrous iron transporter B [Gemmatimonadales bacterium]|nr:ferrous iron transporter B [Gemmatimonadales bacterium]